MPYSSQGSNTMVGDRPWIPELLFPSFTVWIFDLLSLFLGSGPCFSATSLELPCSWSDWPIGSVSPSSVWLLFQWDRKIFFSFNENWGRKKGNREPKIAQSPLHSIPSQVSWTLLLSYDRNLEESRLFLEPENMNMGKIPGWGKNRNSCFLHELFWWPPSDFLHRIL